ncbi:hypothetical protein U1Q18_039537, partial [Sarracenia purpurea var. burkii]
VFRRETAAVFIFVEEEVRFIGKRRVRQVHRWFFRPLPLFQEEKAADEESCKGSNDKLKDVGHTSR